LIFWGLFLHFYQPPTQYPWVLEKITEECYRPLIRVFKEHPRARASVNVNGVLLEMFQHQGAPDVVQGMRELIASGQWEVTGTAKYHVILPLVPPDEAARQIELQKACLREYLHVEPRAAARGFFPPEMCYSPEILPIIRDAGHEWALLSGTSSSGAWPRDFVGRARAGGLRVLFRDEILSNRISFDKLAPKAFLDEIAAAKTPSGNGYVITAMDAETYGHHIPHWERAFLGEAFRLLAERSYAGRVRSATLSDIVDAFGSDEIVDPKPSSWSTTHADLEAGVPFPLWKDPRNPVHHLQWEIVNLAIEQVKLAESLAHIGPEPHRFAEIARRVLDPALHSCQFWWASRRPLGDIQMIYKGLWLLEEATLNASRAVFRAPGHEPAKTQAQRNLRVSDSAAAKLREHLACDA
jgi:alpha-amylase/alpha-mannosidase (GH57 family)